MSNGDREQHPYHRRFVRHKVRLRAEVQSGRTFSTWTNNVSQDGVCFEIPETVAVGTMVRVSIYIPRKKGREPLVVADCRVVWKEPGKKGMRHGAQFVSFAENGRERLIAWLARA